jgi:uncharacterized membrane protein
MLDRLPALARHLVLTLAAVLLSWAGSDVVPALVSSESDALRAVGAIVGALLPVVLSYVTTLTRQYGAGSDEVTPEG